MEKKQTAVSQIFAQIKAARKDTKFWNDSMLVDWLLEQKERYKQMEKEQMIDAWVNGCDNGYDKACDNITWEEMDSAKDNYYNETYGGENG